MLIAYCLLCRPNRTGLKAEYLPLRFLEHARDVHGVAEADLEYTRPVKGESDSTVWLLPDGRAWLHVVKG